MTYHRVGLCSYISFRLPNRLDRTGASFNNFLDAIDGSYCTFEGGDDPNQDGIYPDSLPGGYTGMSIYPQLQALILILQLKGPEACGTVKPSYVISTSYGYNEADLSPFYAERQCAEYAKLGLMGITVLFSSGDYGVAGSNSFCLNPDGKNCSHDVIPDSDLITSFQVRKLPMDRSSTPPSLGLVHMSHLLVLRW